MPARPVGAWPRCRARPMLPLYFFVPICGALTREGGPAMLNFTPWSALGGGVLIGAAAVLLLGLPDAWPVAAASPGALVRASGRTTLARFFLAGLLLGTGASVGSSRHAGPACGVSRALAGDSVALHVGSAPRFRRFTSGHGVCWVAPACRRARSWRRCLYSGDHHRDNASRPASSVTRLRPF